MVTPGRGGYGVLPDAPLADLDAYRTAGGGRGIAAAAGMRPEAVIDLLARAGLRGRGGGGFPVAEKWRTVRDAGRHHGDPVFVVANGAEGEPGSWKDRTLIDRAPFAVVEGALVAARAVGAHEAVVAVRASDGGSARRLHDAVAAARAVAWPAADALRVATVPDHYLAGEETALLEVLEGRPALPRTTRPDAFGLDAGPRRANPTTVSNVETLAHAARILADGPPAFRSVGTERWPGTMIATVTGDVGRPGVTEVGADTTLDTLLRERAGAVDIQAVLAGVSGGVIHPSQLHTPLDPDRARTAGFAVGSGAFIVLDESRCVLQAVVAAMRFLADASCGQCLACSGGTTDIAGGLARIDAGDGTRRDLDRVTGRVRWLGDGVRCGLPRGAGLAVTGLLRWFGDDVRAHLDRGCRSDRPLQVADGSAPAG